MNIKSKTGGFSTIELLIALMIISATLSAVVLITLGLPRAIMDGEAEGLASIQAINGLNVAFRMGLVSFDSVVSTATTTAAGISSSVTVTLLPDALTKNILSTASWVDLLGHTRYEIFSGIITDFKNVNARTCSNVLVGNWLHPLITNTSTSPYPLSAVAVDSSPGSSLLVGASKNSQNPSDPTIHLFSIASTTHPTLLSSIDNALGTKTGVSALAVYNKIIYAANYIPANFSTCVEGPSCSQLQIIDATNLSAPTIISNFQLATNTPPYATGSGSQSVGRSIFYANNLVYLGLQKVVTSTTSPQGDEFNIIDVHDPLSPEWLGGYAVGRTINQIQVQDGYAYLATDDPSRELLVLDVHDPQHITLAGSYDAPGYSTYGYGEAISVASTTIALGRSYSPNASNLLFFNTHTGSPSFLGSDQSTDPLAGLSIRGVLIRNTLSFVLSSSSLQIWNMSDPKNPYLYTSPIPLPAGTTATTNALTCKQNTLYVASNNGVNQGYLSAFTGS